jgi:hypothetical protein
MRNSSDGTNMNRIEALRRRETSLKAAITAERLRLQKHRERAQARLISIIGSCLLSDLKANPQLTVLLQESVRRCADPRDIEFLHAQGWEI